MQLRIYGVFCLTALSVGCAGGSEAPGLDIDLAEKAQRQYAKLVFRSYQDTLSAAQKMDQSIGEFLDAPSAAGLKDAKQAWKDAREPYLQTEAFRFYSGPIEDIEGLINAWPLDENYVDYVEEDPQAGLINDPSFTIDEESLVKRNERGGEKNIATGYHAIEFLLWGQDLRADGPGDRPYTDYVDGGTADHQDRRRLYLKTVSKLLLKHLQQLVDAWRPNEDNYRAEFEAAEPKEAMRRILTGLTILSGFETGGERIQPALDTGLQEDEHSCFSDNTHRDMIQDVRGIQNVFLGRYEALDGSIEAGTSVYEVIQSTDVELANTTRDHIANSLKLAKALHAPFDQEIRPDNADGNARVAALLQGLQDQAADLEQVFPLYDLSVMIPE